MALQSTVAEEAIPQGDGQNDLASGTKLADETGVNLERTTVSGDYLRVFTYGTSFDSFAYAAGFLAAAAAGITMPLMFIVFGSFVGEFTTIMNRSPGQDGAAFEDNIDTLCLYMMGLFLGRFVLGSIHKFSFRMVGIRISAAIRLHYLQNLLDQSIHTLDSLPPGFAVGSITSTSNILQLGISEKLGTFVEYTSLVIAAICVSFAWSWELTLVTCAGLVTIFLTVGTLFPLIVRGQARQNKPEIEAAAVASETFASIRMVMAYGAEPKMVEKYGAFIKEAEKHARSLTPLTSLQFGLTFLGVFGTVALTFWYGTKAFTEGRIDEVGNIIVALMNIMTVFFSMERVSAPMQAMGKATLAACELFSVIDAPRPPKGHIKEPEVSSDDDIVFEGVTFAYPRRPEVKILDGLDLRIEAGKVTAIVGPSGSGKSTIVGLIERWYTLKQQRAIAKVIPKDKVPDNAGDSENPQDVDLEAPPPHVQLKGTVSTCGHALDDIDMLWWRAQIGLVQQDSFLFNDSVYLNVARGLIGSPWENESETRKRELVREACVEAFADEFIKNLPRGYDTSVGDGGARLSGGQRQRLAIARAVVRKPAILILDEATSSIDVRGEQKVQQALDRAAKNRTTIIIAHRLSTIKNADRIVVLKGGKVVESGTHSSLSAKQGGVYATLVSAQSLSLDACAFSDPVESDDLDAERGDNIYREKSKVVAPTNNVSESGSIVSEQKRGLLSSFGLFFLESRPRWATMILTAGMSAAAGTAQPLYAWLNARSISQFEYLNDHSKLMSKMSFTSIMWTVFAASAGVVYFITFLGSGRVATFIRAKYQTQYFESIIFQKAAYFDEDDHSQGTLSSRVKDDPVKLEGLMGTNLAMILISISNIIGGMVMALVYNWKLALVAICVIMPISIFSGYVRFKYEQQFERMNDAVFAESSQFASEAFAAFKTVTSLSLESVTCDRFKQLCANHVTAAYKKARWVSILLGFADATPIGCQALIFYYGGRLIIRGEIGMMAFFVCLMAMMNAGEGLGQSLSFGPNAAEAKAASNRILNARLSRIPESGENKVMPETEDGAEIELRDVRLTYATRSIPVLRRLNLTVKRGQFAALVGASGCGKTSVISLIERFYEPDDGQILLNGNNIADMDVHEYRKIISLVAQEPTLFKGTIRENIALGSNGSTVTDEQLYAVCRVAAIHDYIISLPEGYDTDIGSRGVSLSGGQKQRISIARALIRDPKILLLDEATSSLDSESEKFVQAAIEHASNGRTMVMVAHRLATVQNADIIFALGEGGILLEKGSHAELLAKQGVYFQMCQSQALDQ